MRVALAIVAAGLVCSMTAEAEARARGGGLFRGARGSSAAAPIQPVKTAPRAGVGVGVVVPVGYGRSERASARNPQQQHFLPLPPRPAEDADAPRIHSASADAAPSVATEPKRPWCQDGRVVGRGSGFCEVTLAADRGSAPALLTLGN
jgi:hypothetical protein